MADKKQFDTDLKYAQWNPFFISLQKDLDEIKRVNKYIRKDLALIDTFFCLINALFNSTETYISNAGDMQKKLNRVETKVYNPKYLKDLRNKKLSSNLTTYQHRMIKDLEMIFQEMIRDYASKDLLPKIIATEKKPKGRALLS